MAKALHLPLRARALPARTRCPLCGAEERLLLYQDSISGGQWYSCDRCKSHGDMIELAATAWGVDPDIALQRLGGVAHLDPACFDRKQIKTYVESHAGYRRRVEQLWRKAQAYGAKRNSRVIRSLQQMHCFPFRGSQERWDKGPKELIGALPYNEVDRCLMPKLKRVNKSGDRTFKGDGWTTVLVVPFYDMPGRICMFAFLGRGGNPVKDLVYRSINLTVSRRQTADGGLAGLPTIDKWDPSKPVIAVDDWLLMLQVQMRAYSSINYAMPMVAWHEDEKRRTRAAWQSLHDREIVFWGMDVTPGMVRQAVEVDGQLAIMGPENQSQSAVRSYLRHYPGVRLHTAVCRQGVAWHKSLAAWMKRTPDKKVSRLLADLEETGEDVSYILRRCGQANRSLVMPAERLAVCVNRKTILERSGMWFFETKPGKPVEILSDATFRILHTIKDQATDRLYYNGYITYKDQQIPFLEPAESMDKAPLQRIRDILIDQDLGDLRFQRNWSKFATEIAMELHPPTLIKDTSMIGWDHQTQSFRFKKYTISSVGNVRPNPMEALVPDGHGPNNDEPAELRPSLWPRGKRKGDDAFALAAVSAVVANLIAPAFGATAKGICPEPGATRLTYELLERLGCPTEKLTITNHVNVEDGGGWPTLYSRAANLNLNQINCWAASKTPLMDDSNCNRNVVFPLDPLTATCRMIDNTWLYLKLGDAIELPRGDWSQVIPAFLKNLCVRRLALSRSEEPWQLQVMWSLAKAFNLKAVIPDASLLLVCDEAKRDLLYLSIVYHLYANKDFSFCHDVGVAVSDENRMFIDGDGYIHVNLRRIEDYLYGRSITPPTRWAILTAAERGELFKDVKDDEVTIPNGSFGAARNRAFDYMWPLA